MQFLGSKTCFAGRNTRAVRWWFSRGEPVEFSHQAARKGEALTKRAGTFGRQLCYAEALTLSDKRSYASIDRNGFAI